MEPPPTPSPAVIFCPVSAHSPQALSPATISVLPIRSDRSDRSRPIASHFLSSPSATAHNAHPLAPLANLNSCSSSALRPLTSPIPPQHPLTPSTPTPPLDSPIFPLINRHRPKRVPWPRCSPRSQIPIPILSCFRFRSLGHAHITHQPFHLFFFFLVGSCCSFFCPDFELGFVVAGRRSVGVLA